MRIFMWFHRGEASSTISPNFEHEFCRHRVLHIYTRHTSLRAASHRAIGYIQNQHPINAMYPICLNSCKTSNKRPGIH